MFFHVCFLFSSFFTTIQTHTYEDTAAQTEILYQTTNEVQKARRELREYGQRVYALLNNATKCPLEPTKIYEYKRLVYAMVLTFPNSYMAKCKTIYQHWNRLFDQKISEVEQKLFMYSTIACIKTAKNKCEKKFFEIETECEEASQPIIVSLENAADFYY